MGAPAQHEQSAGLSDTQLLFLDQSLAESQDAGPPVINNAVVAAPGATPPNDLPDSTAGFVGRRAEIERCLEALAPDERGWGVLIDGMGGIGKTALALEVARQARAAQLFDADLFVSAKTNCQLAEGLREETLAHSSLDAFVREFLRLLGESDLATIPDAPGRRQALLASLQKRRTLLIWDNLESLIDEERLLITEFLRRLPGPAKAIVTSRRRLGESAVELRLERLSEADTDALIDELSRRDPRIAAALTQAGADARRQLREIVDGNPLALQMSLGLVAQTGCALEAALSRMRDPVRSGDLYRFLFAEALDGLAKSDRVVLATLIGFRTTANAEALVDATGLPPAEVVQALERLTRLALVDEGTQGGYSLHALTRTYVRTVFGQTHQVARAALSQGQVDAQAQRRALRYWVDYAGKYQSESGELRSFDELDLEWPHLEAAAITLYELSGLPGPLKDPYAARMLNDLAKSLFEYLQARSYWDEQLRLGEWAYDAACALEGWQSAGWRAYQVAWTHYRRADSERALVWVDRMVAAMERAGNRRDRAVAWRLQGLVAEQRGDLAAAERLFVEALAMYRELKIVSNQITILCDLGAVAQRLKQIDRADGYYQHALELAEQIGSQEHQAICANNLGLLAWDRSRPSQARAWYERGLNLALAIGRHDLVAYAQYGLARVLEVEWRYDEALDLAEQALELQENLRDRDREVTRELVMRLRRRVGKI
jgi:tetratricopeptide (TPR) repeat protein